MKGQSLFRFGALLVWGASFWLPVLAKVVPFVEPGFFFDYNPPGTSVPIPVTAQCETIHIEWGRSGAIGPNPVAPYSLQIYTSTSVFPFLMDAGSGLSFDWAVPFAPGTQYQICMFDKNGVPGGCQAMYTVIQNTTVSTPTCQNVTAPANPLQIVGTVANGPLSQYGFIDQCTDVSIKPTSGTPPFILTIAPPLHPPFNLTSYNLDPITWTVSLSRAMPFFMSLVSADGRVWANGPMHAGGFGSTDCLAPGTIPVNRAKATAAGAAIGGIFGGAFLVASIYLFKRYWDRRKEPENIVPLDEKEPERPLPEIGGPQGLGSDIENSAPVRRRSTKISRPARSASIPSNLDNPFISHKDRLVPVRSSSATTVRSLPRTPAPVSGRSADSSSRYSSQLSLTPDGSSQSALPLNRSQVYVLHHDGGRAPVTVYNREDAEVVELPPSYSRNSGAEPSGSASSSTQGTVGGSEKTGSE